MSTRNVVLTDQNAEVIDRLVKSGRYQNANEVLDEGLRLVQDEERIHALELEFLRREYALGEASGEAEEIDSVQFLQELQAERRSGRG
ncbi:type II toxin-antitoxin system ParD family antitoxin [Neorhizobium sp. NPDC001467]|uniref:type II toxin-antitoxin system ParD family antitoxin n=1 Tax=Neorhizobium sp. NPDC001467 TaxID=3390595 RepID=UPI003D00EA84